MTMTGNANHNNEDADILRMDDEGPIPQPRPAAEAADPTSRDDLATDLATGK